jgi:molybdopterin molybdotransferase
LRVRWGSDGSLHLHPNQGSGVLSSLAFADGLAVLAPGQAVAPGDAITLWPLRELTC